MAEGTLTVKRRHGNRQMLHLVELYKRAHPDEGTAINPAVVAKWVIENGEWRRPPIDPEQVLRGQIRRALRDEPITDPQNREVRANHPVMELVRTPEGTKWLSMWYPIFEMPPPKMRASLQLRRRSALSDVVQLDLDFKSYNDNNIFGERLQPLDFDFNKDLEEMALPTGWSEGSEDELGPTLQDEEDQDEV